MEPQRHLLALTFAHTCLQGDESEVAGSSDPPLCPGGARKPGWVSVLFLLVFSHSVMSDSFQPHGLQHSKLLCP